MSNRRSDYIGWRGRESCGSEAANQHVTGRWRHRAAQNEIQHSLILRLSSRLIMSDFFRKKDIKGSHSSQRSHNWIDKVRHPRGVPDEMMCLPARPEPAQKKSRKKRGMWTYWRRIDTDTEIREEKRQETEGKGRETRGWEQESRVNWQCLQFANCSCLVRPFVSATTSIISIRLNPLNHLDLSSTNSCLRNGWTAIQSHQHLFIRWPNVVRLVGLSALTCDCCFIRSHSCKRLHLLTSIFAQQTPKRFSSA